MHSVLSEVISAFRGAQDLAVATLRDRLGVPLPSSNLDWSRNSHTLDLPRRGSEIGVEISPHGYGVRMGFPSVSIDFDWGERGEGYGFDLWRLWEHCEVSRLFLDSLTYDSIKYKLELAEAATELVGDRLLLCLPEERVRYGMMSYYPARS